MEKNEINFNRVVSTISQLFNFVDEYAKKIQNSSLKNSVHIKEENQKFTDLDWLIQKLFENTFHQYFPNITVFGEEDTSININISSDHELLVKMKQINPSKPLLDNEEGWNFCVKSSQQITLFIDPIDATNQLILHNYEPATVLVGICIDSKPTIGFIHYPFETKRFTYPITIFNYPSKGVFKYTNNKENKNRVEPLTIPENKKWTFIVSKSRAKPEMISFIKLFPNSEFVQENGLGNKAVELILNNYVYFSTGMYTVGYWDVCAADCICREIGGGFYDFDGLEISYASKKEYINKLLFLVNDQQKREMFCKIVKENNVTNF